MTSAQIKRAAGPEQPYNPAGRTPLPELSNKNTNYSGQAGTFPTQNREVSLSLLSDYARPLINSGDRSRRVVAAMLRAAFPGVSVEQRSILAGRLLGCHPRHARRLEMREVKPTAEHFLNLMAHLGVEETIIIIESEGR